MLSKPYKKRKDAISKLEILKNISRLVTSKTIRDFKKRAVCLRYYKVLLEQVTFVKVQKSEYLMKSVLIKRFTPLKSWGINSVHTGAFINQTFSYDCLYKELKKIFKEDFIDC